MHDDMNWEMIVHRGALYHMPNVLLLLVHRYGRPAILVHCYIPARINYAWHTFSKTILL